MRVSGMCGVILAQFLVVSMSGGCHPLNENFKTVGFLAEAGSDLRDTIIKNQEFIQFLKCKPPLNECSNIKQIHTTDENLTKIHLKNKNLIIIRRYSDETAMFHELKAGSLDALFGVSDWIRAAEAARKRPGISLISSKEAKSFYLYTNFKLPSFDLFRRELGFSILWTQLTMKNLTSNNSLTELKDDFITSIDLSKTANQLARSIKLSNQLQSIKSSLFIETQKEFTEKLKQIRIDKSKVLRISTSETALFFDDFDTIEIRVRQPILMSAGFKDFF